MSLGRSRLEGTHIGRKPLVVDREAIYRDHCQGQSLRQIARRHRISTPSVQRVLRDQEQPPQPVKSQPYVGVTKALEKVAH